jgi:hypothetical protein
MDHEASKQEPRSTEGGEVKIGYKVWVLCEVIDTGNDSSEYIELDHHGYEIIAHKSDCRPVEFKVGDRVVSWSGRQGVLGYIEPEGFPAAVRNSMREQVSHKLGGAKHDDHRVEPASSPEIPDDSSEPMREAFEADLIQRHGWNQGCFGRNENQYFDSSVEMAWQAYQAGVKYGDPSGGWQPSKEEIEYAKDRCGAPASDPVNPSHYKQGGIECIEAIKAATGEGFVGYVWGNVLKYLWRWPKKGGVDDLKKARWYLDRLIKEVGE